MRRPILTTFSIAIVSFCTAQQLPLFTQYAFDPYLINPSMVAYTNRPEINLLYRRQWSDIQDGPKTLQFDAQLPLSNKMAIGVNLYNDKTVLLSATSVLFTFGYKVQLAENHTLGFGLSGGIFSNHFRLEDVPAIDATDPALLNGVSNNLALNGQFGTNYKFKNFSLGLSFVNLLERKTVSPEKFQEVQFGQLKNLIVFTSYRFTIVPETWFVQPNLAYRVSQDDINYFEASAIVSYKNIIDLGGGYRQDFGPTLMLRLHLKSFHAGLAYDVSSQKAQVSPGGTQELQLKWRQEDQLTKSDQKKSTIQSPEESPKPEPKEEKQEIKAEPQIEPKETKAITPKVEVAIAEVVKEEPVRVIEEPKPVVEESKDSYFVIGTFENREHAEQLVKKVEKTGKKAEIKESKLGTLPHYYYVHLPAYRTKEVTFEKITELQKTTGFKDAWFTKID